MARTRGSIKKQGRSLFQKPLCLLGDGHHQSSIEKITTPTHKMLTLSKERFHKIQKEAPVDCQKYLVQVTNYEEDKHCKTWIVGKWATPREQYYAPLGTHFHQFVVPPIISFRRDCTYGELAAMKLPDDVEGLGSCEYTMGRGVVHACHAGGAVHFLEGWKHHEVGAINVYQIDVVWKAALRHGFKPL